MIYEEMAREFVKKNGLDIGDVGLQLLCTVEEVGEVAKAVLEGGNLEKEIADALFTLFVLAELVGMDVQKVYFDVGMENLGKSGKTEGGKVK